MVAGVALQRQQVKVQPEGADVEALVLNALCLTAGPEVVVPRQALQLSVLKKTTKMLSHMRKGLTVFK